MYRKQMLLCSVTVIVFSLNGSSSAQKGFFSSTERVALVNQEPIEQPPAYTPPIDRCAELMGCFRKLLCIGIVRNSDGTKKCTWPGCELHCTVQLGNCCKFLNVASGGIRFIGVFGDVILRRQDGCCTILCGKSAEIENNCCIGCSCIGCPCDYSHEER